MMQVFFEDYLGAETAFCHTPKGVESAKGVLFGYAHPSDRKALGITARRGWNGWLFGGDDN